MAFPVFHEFDTDGTIRTNGLHWEGFPRLAWEALSAAGYLTPSTYEVKEFERYGVPRCRVIVTVLGCYKLVMESPLGELLLTLIW
jgi:hypothetical protein